MFSSLAEKYNFRASEQKPEWKRKSEGEKEIVMRVWVIEKHLDKKWKKKWEAEIGGQKVKGRVKTTESKREREKECEGETERDKKWNNT